MFQIHKCRYLARQLHIAKANGKVIIYLINKYSVFSELIDGDFLQ